MLFSYELTTNLEIHTLSDLSKLKSLTENTNLKVNDSELSRKLGKDRRTIKKYRNGYVKPTTRKRSSTIDDYYDTIKKLLNNQNKYFAYKRVLWQYLKDNYGLKCASSSFRRYITQHPEFDEYFKKNRASNTAKPSHMRYETDAGVQAQLDWKESVPFITKDGESLEVNIFSLFLSYSRYRIYKVSLNKNQNILFHFLNEAFNQLGDVPKELLADNMKTVMDEAEQEADPNAKEPTLEKIETYLRKKKYEGQKTEKLRNLPHEKILMKMHPDDQSCCVCKTKMSLIGEEFVRTEVQFIPAQLKVIDYYREVYECRKCRQKTGFSHIEKSPVADPVIPHSYASATSVAFIMYQKFVNALPLYRLEKDWKNLGLELSRATMSNWIIIASNEWLKPIIEEMHRKMIGEKYLHADETPVQVLREAGRKNTTKSYMWMYGTYKGSKTPIRLFDYRPTRSGENANEYLKGFNGYLISDAYAGYNQVEGVTRCYCWAHLRRYFVDSLPKDIKRAEATAPQKAIELIGRLFAIEDTIADKAPENKVEIRQKESKPIVDLFFAWIEENQNKYLSKSKLGKAFQYASNQKEGLMRYLEDGNIEMSNNLAERSIRPLTIGRKNWLFSGSPRGAEASAMVYSIVETAKANNLDPYKYLTYIFGSMPGVDLDEEPDFIEHMLPWSEDAQRICKKAE